MKSAECERPHHFDNLDPTTQGWRKPQSATRASSALCLEIKFARGEAYQSVGTSTSTAHPRALSGDGIMYSLYQG